MHRGCFRVESEKVGQGFEYVCSMVSCPRARHHVFAGGLVDLYPYRCH